MVLAENPMLRPELTVMQGMLDLRRLKPLTVTARESRILQGFCDEKKNLWIIPSFRLFWQNINIKPWLKYSPGSTSSRGKLCCIEFFHLSYLANERESWFRNPRNFCSWNPTLNCVNNYILLCRWHKIFYLRANKLIYFSTSLENKSKGNICPPDVSDWSVITILKYQT